MASLTGTFDSQPMTGNSRRPSPLWQRLLLAAASPLVFIALAEGVIRLANVETELARNGNYEIALPVWVLADPGWVHGQRERLNSARGVRAEDVEWLRHFEEARYVHYRLKPNIDVAAVNPFNDIEVAKRVTFRLTSNQEGFRGPEITRRNHDARPRNVGGEAPRPLRVVTFGDSSTFGWGVDLEHTFQAQLADRLRALGHDAEVLNFGIPGYTSRHGLGVQRHYAKDLAPDVVVIAFGANDGRESLQSADEELSVDDRWVSGVAWRLRRFETFKLLRRAIFSVYDPFLRSDGQVQASRPTVPSVTLAEYRSNLLAMERAARAGGAEVVYLSVCAPDAYRDEMLALARERRVPTVDAVNLFRNLADDLRDGTLYPEDTDYYRQLYGQDTLDANWRYYVTTDGCHPNRAGHRIIADALVEALDDLGIVRDRNGTAFAGEAP